MLLVFIVFYGPFKTFYHEKGFPKQQIAVFFIQLSKAIAMGGNLIIILYNLVYLLIKIQKLVR